MLLERNFHPSIDLDVMNMGAYGVAFQDADQYWTDGRSSNIDAYITIFGETVWLASNDSPIFWETWRIHAVHYPYTGGIQFSTENHDWYAEWATILDWEHELIGDYVGSVFADVIRQHDAYTLNYLA